MSETIKSTEDLAHHEGLMDSLTKKHDLIVDLIGNRNVHYVDVPVHGNIGDLLIMFGTLELFRKNALKVPMNAPYFAYDPRWASKGDVVVCHGGGNFGDLYLGPQELRETVVRTAKRSRVVILPQTIHFESEARFDRCVKEFRKHPDVHIFVRDSKSLEFAKEISPSSYLVPDMAHQLWNSSRFPRTPIRNGRHITISRTDGEKHGRSCTEDKATIDWPELVGRTRSEVIRYTNYLVKHGHKLGINRLALKAEMKAWTMFSRWLCEPAIKRIGSAQSITTDRLHGHILACLLSTPNRVVDNSYGKNSSYIREWTAGSPLVSLSAS